MSREPSSSVRRGGRLTRRSLLANLSLGLGTAALLPTLSVRRALAATGTDPAFLVVVNLLGGNDTLNTVVPRGVGAYYDARPRVAIPADQALPLADEVGLHPSLAPLLPYWQAGDLAVVRQVGYPDPNLSHFESMDVWSRGKRDLDDRQDLRGWIGRCADAFFPGALDVVGVGTGRRTDFVADTGQPLVLDSLAAYGPGRKAVPWWEVEHRDTAARAMLAAGPAAESSPGRELRRALRGAYDLSDFLRAADDAYASTVEYPGNGLGQNLRDVAKLVQGRTGGRIFYTGTGGFDTHADQAGWHASLMDGLAISLDAFARDLQAMGAWDRAVVLVISEFGRRTYDNASNGTDHGHGLSVLALGGLVRGGLHGPAFTDAVLREEYLPGAVDFRAVYAAVLRRHLGVEPVPTAFPEAWPGDPEIPIL